MRILLDECVPVASKRHLVSLGHECQTVPEAGFAGKKNGELLALAERRWDVLLYDGSQNPIPTTGDRAKDWDPGSPRQDEPTTGSPDYFADLRASAFLNPTRSGSSSRSILGGF
jgi:hypothetical protein